MKYELMDGRVLTVEDAEYGCSVRLFNGEGELEASYLVVENDKKVAVS